MTTQPTLQRFCFIKSQTKVSHVTLHSVDLVEEHVLNRMFWPLRMDVFQAHNFEIITNWKSEFLVLTTEKI